MKAASGVAAVLAVFGVPIVTLALALSILSLFISTAAYHRAGKAIHMWEPVITEQAQEVAELTDLAETIAPPDA
jgi:uncharacterized membrane protein